MDRPLVPACTNSLATLPSACAGCARRRRLPPVAVLLPALGIGANTAVFGIVDPLLFRTLAVTAPDRLVLLQSVCTLRVNDIWPRSAADRFASARDVLDAVLSDAALFEYDSAYGDRRSRALISASVDRRAARDGSAAFANSSS